MSRLAVAFMLLAVLAISTTWLLENDASGEPAPVHWRGVVLGPDGEPLHGAHVTLRTPKASCLVTEGLSFLETATDAEGRFALEGPAGEMEIYVEHPLFAPTWRPGVEEQMIQLRPAAWLTMDVPDGASARVTHGMRLFAAAEAGAARLGPLPPDLPLLVSVSSNHAQTQQASVTLREGESRTLSVVLADGFAIRGRVVPARAGVMLFASQGEARQSRATSAADGSFEIRGLRAGKTRIVAILPEGGVTITDCDAGDQVQVELAREEAR